MLLQRFIKFLVIICLICTSVNPVIATESEARLYTTREEKREAGIKHKIFPWLIASGLAEFEWDWQKTHVGRKGKDNISDMLIGNVQGNFFATPLEWLNSEIIIEYDTEIDELRVDEAEIAFEYENWELAFGKIFLPFGNYISHFANGPIIEFGETSGTAISLSYNYNDIIDFSVAAFRSKARKLNSDNRIDWSAALETWPADNVSIGISYLSDLADSDDRLLADFGNRYSNKVPALSGYLLWVDEDYEISLELLGALDTFDEFSSDRNQPAAFSLEFAYFSTPKLDWSFRFEGSHELEDAPALQVGLAVNYRIFEQAFITIEALHGFFEGDLSTDDFENPNDSITTFGTLLSVGF